MLIGWEACNYFINCTAVQILPKQTKWRKAEWRKATKTRRKLPQRNLKHTDERTKAPNFNLKRECSVDIEELDKLALQKFYVEVGIKFCHINK